VRTGVGPLIIALTLGLGCAKKTESNETPTPTAHNSGTARCAGESLHLATGNYCIYRSRASWEMARTTCQLGGGHLVVIDSAEEQRALYSRLGTPGLDYGRLYWIGYTDSKEEGVWLTPGGDKAGYTHWAPYQPNNAGKNENCAYWNSDDGRWDDNQCESKKVGICEERVGDRAEADSARACPGRLITLKGRRYCITKNQRTWLETQSACQVWGGNLVVIDDYDENQRLFTALHVARYWIGLSDLSNEDQWETVNGAPVTYTLWSNGQPDNSGGHESCAEWVSPTGQWNDTNCEFSRRTICELP
jgi:hypothetical protein